MITSSYVAKEKIQLRNVEGINRNSKEIISVHWTDCPGQRIVPCFLRCKHVGGVVRADCESAGKDVAGQKAERAVQEGRNPGETINVPGVTPWVTDLPSPGSRIPATTCCAHFLGRAARARVSPSAPFPHHRGQLCFSILFHLAPL